MSNRFDHLVAQLTVMLLVPQKIIRGDLFEKLLGKERVSWWRLLERFLRKEPCFVEEKRIFLDYLRSAEIPIDGTIPLREFFSLNNTLVRFQINNERTFSGILDLAIETPPISVTLELWQLRRRTHRTEFSDGLPSHYVISTTNFFYALASEIIKATKGVQSEMLGEGTWRSLYIPDYQVMVKWMPAESSLYLNFEKYGGQEDAGALVCTERYKKPQVTP